MGCRWEEVAAEPDGRKQTQEDKDDGQEPGYESPVLVLAGLM